MTENNTEKQTEQSSLLETVENYEPKHTGNISELESFDLTEPTETRTAKDKEGKEFSYKVLIRDGKEYRIPWNVLSDIKELRKSKPNLQAFQVIKSGSGLETRYRTIPHVTGV